ncbi:MotA/TolQ/ExbB proton channel family protein [Marivirga tractuosa]|uniref:MotA/TolQ/ExbB proton channel family protein n=1 Tax=Marivirga tractuosa TaxID=1006 RepID=UPI0035D09F9F
MNFIEFHIEGGIEFMSVLFLLLLGVIVTSVLTFKNRADNIKANKWLKISQDIALFALVLGILGQLVGLLAAFQALEEMGEVSQGILAGGLKISSYTTVYGIFIFLLAKLFKIIFQFTQK